MLESMKVKKVTNKSVTWGPDKNRRKGGVTNAEIGEFVTKQGRPFNFMSKEDIEKVEKLVDKILQKQMRRV